MRSLTGAEWSGLTPEGLSDSRAGMMVKGPARFGEGCPPAQFTSLRMGSRERM